MTSGSTVHVLIVKVDLTNGYHFTLLTLLGVYRPSGKLCDVINIEGHMRGTCIPAMSISTTAVVRQSWRNLSQNCLSGAGALMHIRLYVHVYVLYNNIV